MKIAEGFGERLWKMRDGLGWTQTELASRAGISPTTVVHLERDAQLPRMPTLRKLAGAIGVSVQELAEGEAGRRIPLGLEVLQTLREMQVLYAPGSGATLDWSKRDLERIAGMVASVALGSFAAELEAGRDDLAQELALRANAVKEALLSRVPDAPERSARSARYEAAKVRDRLRVYSKAVAA